VRAGNWLGLGSAVALELGQIPAKAKSGRVSLRANQTTSFFFATRFGSGEYSEKLLAGTRDRFPASPSGGIANLARPITNAVLTFNRPQTGTVQIVGARRPRRASQVSQGGGVSASRDEYKGGDSRKSARVYGSLT
jgi:hypothetical protein